MARARHAVIGEANATPQPDDAPAAGIEVEVGTAAAVEDAGAEVGPKEDMEAGAEAAAGVSQEATAGGADVALVVPVTSARAVATNGGSILRILKLQA